MGVNRIGLWLLLVFLGVVGGDALAGFRISQALFVETGIAGDAGCDEGALAPERCSVALGVEVGGVDFSAIGASVFDVGSGCVKFFHG